MGAGPYGGSCAPLLLNLIRLANPFLKYANVCGPPVMVRCRAVAQRLRTSALVNSMTDADRPVSVDRNRPVGICHSRKLV